MAHDVARTMQLLSGPRSEDDITEIFLLNRGLAFNQLKKFGLLNDHDGMSYANEALYKAIKTYDISKDHRFSTYASVCIYNRLGSYVRMLKNKMNTNTISYDALVASEINATHEAFLCSSNTADGEYLQECAIEHINSCVAHCMRRVSDSHKKVLAVWIESEYKKTTTQIANELGISQSYVSRTINIFRKELKNKLKGSLI